MYRERRIPANEAQRILARALDLQRAEGGGRDMSDEELANAASELGVEPRLLLQAMSDDGGGPDGVRGARSWFVGVELRPAVERHVSRTIEASDHRRIVDAIRRATGEEGWTEIVGGAIAWTYAPPSQRQARPRLRVRVTPSEQGTTVRVEDDLRSVAGGIFGGVLGGLGTNLIVWSVLVPVVFQGPALVTPLLLGILVIVYAILRAFFGAYARTRRKELARLLSKVAAEVSSPPPPERVRVDARPAAHVEGEEARGSEEQQEEEEEDRGTTGNARS
jgi:hypothetical protein